MPKKEVKVGVRRGQGPPPGYRWGVLLLDRAFREAIAFLSEGQYQHLAMQVKELAREDDPTHSVTSDVRPVENFYEIRDKGGILGNLNVRIFFTLDKTESALVILGVIKKQNDGPTPAGDKVRMRRRMRKYLNGEYSQEP
ncbi:MAG TPA: hypothetical protein PK867_14955 [Pirellulales bacterium]|nr:hypothetical protein [Pirellulales bacterium]